jgi:hypothetical protein
MRNNRIIFYDSFSILVINPSGKIRQLYCPFLVKCIHPIDGIEENTCVYVEQVTRDLNEKLSYLIGGKLYIYSKFKININF